MGNCVQLPDSLGDSIPRKEIVDVTPLKNAKLPIIFVVGGPGSGKGELHPVGCGAESGDTILTPYWLPSGTQCEKLAKKYNYLHVSSGDLLREEVTAESERGIIMAEIMNQGNLVPMDVVLELIKKKMVAAVGSTKGFLIDGYPREKAQGKLFEKDIAPVDLVVYLEVSDQLLRDRLLGRAVTSGRRDDNEVTIRNRIKLFHKCNDDVVRYYRKKLVAIDAERDIDTVFLDVCAAIDSVTPKSQA